MFLEIIQRNSFKTLVIALMVMMLIISYVSGESSVSNATLLGCLIAPFIFLLFFEGLRILKHRKK